MAGRALARVARVWGQVFGTDREVVRQTAHDRTWPGQPESPQFVEDLPDVSATDGSSMVADRAAPRKVAEPVEEGFDVLASQGGGFVTVVVPSSGPQAFRQQHQRVDVALQRTHDLVAAAVRKVFQYPRACHSNCVSRRCTKIGLSNWQPEGAPRDRGHIAGSVIVECRP